jgi:hypothetical protein
VFGEHPLLSPHVLSQRERDAGVSEYGDGGGVSLPMPTRHGSPAAVRHFCGHLGEAAPTGTAATR